MCSAEAEDAKKPSSGERPAAGNLPSTLTRPCVELREEGNIYGTTKPLAVTRVREEHPEVQRERMDLTRSKSPAELSRISGIRDIPIPGLWTEHTMAKEAVKKQKKRCV